MNKEKYLTKNAKKCLVADFFWNLGRTLPHAILTIYLLSTGISLNYIAILQIIFMIVVMLAEFPSGVIADIFSRKTIYVLSVIVNFLSYAIIGFCKGNFILLIIAYILYGLALALKSGTLDAEIVLEYRREEVDIKHYTVMNTYVMSSSSLIGGFIGSILYSYINNKIYVLALIFMIVSMICGSMCIIQNKEKTKKKKLTLKSTLAEIKSATNILKENEVLTIILILFAVTTLFVQPFFQYWQVLYKEKEVPVAIFGVIYLVFQMCNFIAAALYKKLDEKISIHILLLALIPIMFVLGAIFGRSIIVIFPLVVLLFYMYNQHLEVLKRRYSPDKYMSSYFSLIGTIENVASMISVALMAVLINATNIVVAYAIFFIVFTILSVIIMIRKKNVLYNK